MLTLAEIHIRHAICGMTQLLIEHREQSFSPYVPDIVYSLHLGFYDVHNFRFFISES